MILDAIFGYFRTICKSKQGNVALLFALTIFPLLISVGMAIDYGSALSSRTKLQNAIDAAALAAGNLRNGSENPELTAKAFLESNLRASGIKMDTVTYTIDVNKSLNGRTVVISGEIDVPVAFSGFLGIQTIPVAATGTATQAMSHIEVALVLDVSSSMNKQSRLVNLKKAAKEFIDIMLKTDLDKKWITISIVPYGGTVMLGSNFRSYMKNQHSVLNWNGCLDFNDDIFNGRKLRSNSYPALPDFSKYKSKNPWCPPKESGIVPLVNDSAQLKSHIAGLRLSDGTGSDIGSAWGLKTLSPDWRGSFAGALAGHPLDYGDDVMKVMVIMTDGAITAQYRPEKGKNRAKNKQAYNKSKAISNFKKACNESKKDQNITVYTIGFEVRNNTMLDLLKSCATSSNHYFETSGTSIASVFSTIANSLIQLHLSN